MVSNLDRKTALRLTPDVASCPAPSSRPGPRPSPWRWRRLLLALLVALLFLLRRPLLTGLGAVLVSADLPGPVDYVLILDADRAYERGARMYQAGEARCMLLVRIRPGRLEKSHVLLSSVTIARRELSGRGVPHSAVSVLPGEVRGDWEVARRLGEWLRQRPGARVAVLCDRFDSRRKRYVFDAVLGGDAPRVSLHAAPHRRFDETNWWQRKEGSLHLFAAFIRLGFSRLWGEDREPWREWDPDEYEEALRPRE
jgi:hypothetical protein